MRKRSFKDNKSQYTPSTKKSNNKQNGPMEDHHSINRFIDAANKNVY